MRLTLIYPSWTGDYGVFGYYARRSSVWPPLNIALLAAIAEQHGHEVTIVDGEAAGLTPIETVRATLAHHPDAVGFTATSPFYHRSRELAELFKAHRPDLPMIVGGQHPTIVREKALESMFDYAVIGEAEVSLPALLRGIERQEDLAGVKGIIFRRDGVPFATPPADGMADPGATGFPLDQFPWPARHLLPMSKYKLGIPRGRVNFTSVQTTRGCPWKCIFCASAALETTRVVRRSPQSIVDEISHVVETYGIRHIFFVDDVLTLWPEHIIAICDKLDAAGLKITFEGGTRANLMEEALVARLAASGLIRITFGLETVDSEMRKTMKKKVPLHYYADANRVCTKYGIDALNSVMIGLPGETRETVNKTLDFLSQSRDVVQANLAIAIPYPGTEFHDMAISGAHGIQLETDEFSEYLRYGKAVTTVGDLTPNDLVELQNEGFVRIYSKPWRWRAMLHKQGVVGFMLLMYRLTKILTRRWRARYVPFQRHPGQP